MNVLSTVLISLALGVFSVCLAETTRWPLQDLRLSSPLNAMAWSVVIAVALSLFIRAVTLIR